MTTRNRFRGMGLARSVAAALTYPLEDVVARMLETYMRDHYAGASAGVDLFRRVAGGHGDPEIRQAVAAIGEDVAEDKRRLRELMRKVDAYPNVLKNLPARMAERASRLKPNLRLASRSPLSDLLELEAPTVAVHGKYLGWRTLLDLGDDRLPRAELEELAERAKDQEDELEKLRLRCTNALHDN